jgi:hypothetical protein
MSTLNIDTLELVSTLRVAPANGAPSSHDYNDNERDKMVDLAAIADLINDVLRPIVNALPAAAGQGLEGRTLFADTGDQDVLFFDALNAQPLTVADSIRLLQGIINSVKGQVIDLNVEVAQLSAKLSSTYQNDIALALQNITDTLNQIQNAQRTIESRLTTLEAA